jgi:uncharacterized membrane protein YheB (UPF0754 family)
MSHSLNKSLLTNLLSLVLCGVGVVLPEPWGAVVLTMGLYAVSGAVTNWLAVYMLFEKVPGFYGSGVIPARFTEFRAGLRDIIMEQFFTADIARQALGGDAGDAGAALLTRLLPKIDFDKAFDSLTEVILQSSFGSMLAMFGGAKALQPLREPFVARMQAFLQAVAEDREVRAEIGNSTVDSLLARVEIIVDQRLLQLTPELVKEIMERMIERHLGWLVVWGGVVGALLGLLVAVAPRLLG